MDRADAFNHWAREGLDMMGGADGAALAQILDDYLDSQGSDAEPRECKVTPTMNNEK